LRASRRMAATRLCPSFATLASQAPQDGDVPGLDRRRSKPLRWLRQGGVLFLAALIGTVMLANWSGNGAEATAERWVKDNHLVCELSFVTNARINCVAINNVSKYVLAPKSGPCVRRFGGSEFWALPDRDGLFGTYDIGDCLSVIPAKEGERVGRQWTNSHYRWAVYDNLQGCRRGVPAIYQGQTYRHTFSHTASEIPNASRIRLSDVENLEGWLVEINKCSQLSSFSMVGGIGQSASFFSGPESGAEREHQNSQVDPIKEIVLTVSGACIGIVGIYLALFVAPIRGDMWGFFGLTLLMVGFFLAAESRPMSRHSTSLNRRSENVVIKAIIIPELELCNVEMQVSSADIVECPHDEVGVLGSKVGVPVFRDGSQPQQRTQHPLQMLMILRSIWLSSSLTCAFAAER
jgi:hypothetical protein